MKTKNILKIMDYVYENPETGNSSEESLKKRFGKDAYNDFSQYCLGGTEPFAQSLGEGHKLTQHGVRELQRLSEKMERENKVSVHVGDIIGRDKITQGSKSSANIDNSTNVKYEISRGEDDMRLEMFVLKFGEILLKLNRKMRSFVVSILSLIAAFFAADYSMFHVLPQHLLAVTVVVVGIFIAVLWTYFKRTCPNPNCRKRFALVENKNRKILKSCQEGGFLNRLKERTFKCRFCGRVKSVSKWEGKAV